jgi:D-serine deaminase-like pyridoxal phosphate-dependent protein
MEFVFRQISARPYRINEIEKIHTPRLLVFSDRVLRNIDSMKRLLEAFHPPLSFANLCPHVKTHKSAWVTKQLLSAGISFFKSTLNEVNLLIKAGAPQIFIAYPLLEADAAEVAVAMVRNPKIQFYVQVSHPRHVEILRSLTQICWNIFIDVNIGMNRTGLSPDDAWPFFEAIVHQPNLNFAGIHAYDGHVHQMNVAERRSQAAEAMKQVIDLVERFDANGSAPPMTMVAGTPGFADDAEILSRAHLPTQLFFSPGTWIYYDSLSNELWPGAFEIAAVLLAQVIDRPTAGTATLNMGHKRWAVDQGVIDVFSVPGMKALNWSEEHTVVSVPGECQLEIGDYILMAPKHVCSTVNLWEQTVLVDEAGEIVTLNCPVDARNR